MPARADHRPDIDGLRAIAVAIVLLFHLRIPGFTGGFVGVDVFFVISGYLITGIVWRDASQGSFRFSDFYARRLLRLMPAMLVVLCGTSIAAFLIFSPELMTAYAASLWASVLGGSNILYWLEAGYFDVGGRLKPLLHTWSLSVEWQFYLVWPALVLMMVKFARARAHNLIAVLALISLAANFGFERSTIFFNMPFRIFEFALGALLLWVPRRSAYAESAAFIAGAGMIGAATFLFADTLRYPSFFGLLPSVGAAFLIIGGRAPVLGGTLSNPVSAYLGRISYSLYLVHWPLIVFYEAHTGRPAIDAIEPLIIATFGAAVVLHHVVEMPAQHSPVSRPARVACVVALSMLMVVGAHHSRDGMPWRLGDGTDLAQDDIFAVREEVRGRIGCEMFCSFGDEAGRRVLIVGDSHVDHHTRALREMGTEYRFDLLYAASCFFGATLNTGGTNDGNNAKCRVARNAMNGIDLRRYDAIIVGQLWSGYQSLLIDPEGKRLEFPDLRSLYAVMLRDLQARFAGFTGPIVVLGRAPNVNLECYRRPPYLPFKCSNPNSPREFSDFDVAMNEMIAGRVLNTSYVPVYPTICPDNVCQIRRDGQILYNDGHHLSVSGAKLVVPAVLEALKNGLQEHGSD